MHRRTEGNPLVVRKIVLSFGQGEIPSEPGWAAKIPEGIRDAVVGEEWFHLVTGESNVVVRERIVSSFINMGEEYVHPVTGDSL